MSIDKKDVVRLLETIAVYLEIKGENPFKVSAFRKAAHSLGAHHHSLMEISDFSSLPNIGKGTAAVIEEFIQQGESTVLRKLQEEVPKGLIPLLQIPNLGGKKIGKLYKELNIQDVHDLKQACLNKEVQRLTGFGKKTEENILVAIENAGGRRERHPIATVLPLARRIEEILGSTRYIHRYSRAGSLRRLKETVKDLDFVISTSKPSYVKKQLLKMDHIKKIIAAGETKVSVVFQWEREIAVDFRIVRDSEYATALHHFTGSKEHNVKMRQLAKKRGERISEYGVEQIESGKILTFSTEEEFFHHFGLPFIPPELRETGTEVDLYQEGINLVTIKDIKGDLHMHTTWSDGVHSIEEMVEKCRERGYQYAAITDHSRYLKIANGLTSEKWKKQREKIKELNERYNDFTILAGIEMDILPDGTLDFGDELLEEMDFVIASIHSAFSQSKEKIMNRLRNALTNPHVDMIAHPAGRFIGKRDGYELDMDLLLQLAKETNTVLELNSNPERLDLAAEHLKKAQKAGVKIAINTDAHHIQALEQMDIGISAAKKGWIEKPTVINTMNINELMQFLKEKK